MLKVQQITKSFQGRAVLCGVNFTLREGEIVTLLGANGAGKTTILNILLRMLKPDEGTIHLEGKDIFSLSHKEYFPRLAAVLESSQNVYDFLTGRENLSYFAGLMNLSTRSKALWDQVEHYAQRFQLLEHLDKKTGTYSRGMQQKLAIMIALLGDPKLLLLDEPTLGLDIQSKWIMMDFLERMVREEGRTVLLTTHQLDIVEKLKGRVLFLKKGRVESFPSLRALGRGEEGYEVLWRKKSGDIEKILTRGSFEEVYRRFSGREILEIKRVEKDIEQLFMEKSDESTEK